LSKLVQNVQLVHKGRFKITHKNCGVASLLSLAQLLLAKKIGIRADPDSSRRGRLVAIASVALPKRECGRSLKPRRKRGVRECMQWSRDEAGRSAGTGGRPSEAGECAHSEPPDTMRRRRWRTCPDWVCAQNGRQDIIWQKSGHPSEAGGCARKGLRDITRQKSGPPGETGCARSERHDTIRRRRWRPCRNWVCAQNEREDTIWQKSGCSSEARVYRFVPPCRLRLWCSSCSVSKVRGLPPF